VKRYPLSGFGSHGSPIPAGQGILEGEKTSLRDDRMFTRHSRSRGERSVPSKAFHCPSGIILGVLSVLLLFLSACAALRPAAPPLSDPETVHVLDLLKAQAGKVLSFYSMGTVILKQGFVESQEARILVIGTRDPMRIKVEITHPWGRPLLHFLISDDRLEAVSFQKATRYTGPATPETLGRFLPSPPDLQGVWSLLRGYPAPPLTGTAVSESGPRIVWRGASGEPIQILGIRPATLEPERIVFPKSRLNVVFGDFRNSGGIRYAGEIRYLPEKNRGEVIIENERMVFNQDIPEAVFELRSPSTFRTEMLEDIES